MNNTKDELITSVLNSFISKLEDCSEAEIIGFESFGNAYFIGDPYYKIALSKVGVYMESYSNSSQNEESAAE